MNYKNVPIYFAVIIAIVGLLSAFAGEEDEPLGPASPPRHAESEKSLLAAAPRATVTAENNQRCHCADDADPAAEKIIRALRGPLSGRGLEYTDTPLHEVMLDLQHRFAIPIHVDRAALEELGVNIDESVTVNFQNISLGAALRLMLNQFQLTYIIENEVLLVTTHDRAEKPLITCVYDVRDLSFATTTAAKSTSPSTDNNRLAEVIIDCIATDSWSKNGGGQAEVKSLGPDLLVISQTRSVHEEIQHLLNTIRKVKSEQQSAAQHEAAPPAK